MVFSEASLHAQRICARILNERKAVTAIEYALIAALVAVAIIGALQVLGGSISSEFSTVAADL